MPLAGEDTEQQEPLFFVKWYSCFGSQFAVSDKTKYSIAYN